VIVTGGTINISSDIKGDLRVAGGTIMVGGRVEGEVIVAGGNLRVASGAIFEKDVILKLYPFVKTVIQGQLGGFGIS